MKIGAVLIDIDGVLYVGDRPVAGAGEALRELDRRGIPYRFVSNTTRRSRRSVAQRLQILGYAIPEPWIVTAPVAAAAHLREGGGRTGASSSPPPTPGRTSRRPGS